MNGHFEINFILYAGFAIITLALILVYIPKHTKSELNVTTEQMQYAELWACLKSVRLWVFLTELLVMGAAVAIVERLLFIYIEAKPSDGGLGGECFFI